MNPDQNWKETKVVTQDVETILEVPCNEVNEILSLVEKLAVHRFVELLSDHEFKDKDVAIELPYLGTLVLSINNRGKITYNFVVRNSVYREFRDAYRNRKSPLESDLSKRLGSELVKRFEGGEEDLE